MKQTRPAAPSPLFSVWLTIILALVALPAVAASGGPLSVLREGAEAVTDPEAKIVSEALATAVAYDAETEALAERLQQLKGEAANTNARREEFTAQLATSLPDAMQEWTARLPEDASVETLEMALEQELIAADQLRTRINQLTESIGEGLSQPSRLANRLAELERRQEELRAPVAVTEGESTELTEARRARAAAERRRIAAEMALTQAELDLGSGLQQLKELELRALRHRLALREPRPALLQERIAETSRNELDSLSTRLSARLAAQSGAIPANDKVALRVAAENEALVNELVAGFEKLAAQRRIIAQDDELLERDRSGLRDSLARVELGGQSEQVGAWLWAELRRLEPMAVLSDRLVRVRELLGEQRLRLIAIKETQRELANVDELVTTLRQVSPAQDEEDASADTGGRELLADLLEERSALLAELEPLMWRRIAALEQTERNLEARIAANLALRQTLDRHLLWIRSHPPIDRAWLASLPEGLYDLVKPSRFATSLQLMRETSAEHPVRYLGSMLLLAILVVVSRRAGPRIDRLAIVIRDVPKDRYGRSVEALAWTVVAALVWPAAFWLFGNLLQQVGTPGKYSDSLGGAFKMLASASFTLFFLKALVRDRGLAHAHFRWSKPRRDAVRRWVPRLGAVLLPVYFIVALAFLRDQGLAISIHARIAMVVGSLYSAWAIWRMLGTGQLTHRRGADDEPSRLYRLLRVGLPALLIVVAGLSLAGYVYSSAIVFDSMFASVGVLTAVAVIHGMLSRWFVLGERRLAYRRLQQKREAELEAAAESVAGAEIGEAIPLELDQDITLEQVGEHSRRLLRALRLTLLVLGLAWVWSDVLPALFRFDEIALWSITDTGPDGTSIIVPITLLAVMLGMLSLALTFVAAQNLPGLIEIGLLSRVNMDSASRYAFTSVSRYIIVLAGVLVGFSLLGLRWSQLQWMAAALTVGLGFGLQEIFANFVSGLILLFERPFRVGDVITVNNLDGTVTRIRTRATTILDFDNKEIVVPNKAFITGQLVNWTLSDEVTRITLKVGVDYGTNPKLVHRLLLQAAHENARVLKTPPPNSWLLEFGTSSLNFELRVFVGAMLDRLAVINEINTRLIELFQENGITFAYPQLDVHVRDLPEPASPSRVRADAPPPESAARQPGPQT
jgi:potassium efflux system protein